MEVQAEKGGNCKIESQELGAEKEDTGATRRARGGDATRRAVERR